MIQVTKLNKRYGNQTVLNDISFTVKKGEIVGVLGPNGAGKSTLMKIIACFIPATSGSVKIDGLDVIADSLEVRKRIGYLPEKVQLYRDLTVQKLLEYIALIKQMPRSQYKDQVTDLMNICGIAHVAHKHVRKLSKGYCQRVGIAQALLGKPELLILDEPTVGLDPRQIVDIRRIIKQQSGKKTVIISTHMLHEASMLCDSVMIIVNGRIVAKEIQHGLKDSLFSNTCLRLRVQGPLHQVRSEIRALGYELILQQTISNVDQVYDFIVSGVDDSRSQGDIARFIAGKWTLLELTHVKKSLEDFFLDVTGYSEGDVP
jgi:ABC-2 type transport system ATP-binding protein